MIKLTPPEIMMRLLRRTGTVLALLAELLACASALQAQLKSNVAAVNLNALLNSSLTVAAAPGLVNFALASNGVASGSSTITITTSWVLPANAGNVTLYAFFNSAAVALANGAGNNIPSSKVRGSVNGGPFTPFTGSSPFAVGSSITVFKESVANTQGNNNRDDLLNLQIDTTGLGLPPGTYTGLLRIQAQAI